MKLCSQLLKRDFSPTALNTQKRNVLMLQDTIELCDLIFLRELKKLCPCAQCCKGAYVARTADMSRIFPPWFTLYRTGISDQQIIEHLFSYWRYLARQTHPSTTTSDAPNFASNRIELYPYSHPELCIPYGSPLNNIHGRYLYPSAHICHAVASQAAVFSLT